MDNKTYKCCLKNHIVMEKLSPKCVVFTVKRTEIQNFAACVENTTENDPARNISDLVLNGADISRVTSTWCVVSPHVGSDVITRDLQFQLRRYVDRRRGFPHGLCKWDGFRCLSLGLGMGVGWHRDGNVTCGLCLSHWSYSGDWVCKVYASSRHRIEYMLLCVYSMLWHRGRWCYYCLSVSDDLWHESMVYSKTCLQGTLWWGDTLWHFLRTVSYLPMLRNLWRRDTCHVGTLSLGYRGVPWRQVLLYCHVYAPYLVIWLYGLDLYWIKYSFIWISLYDGCKFMACS